MAISEYRELHRLVADRFPDLRLFKDDDENKYVLVGSSGAVEADQITALEIRRLCMGQIGLAQLRQEPRGGGAGH